MLNSFLSEGLSELSRRAFVDDYQMRTSDLMGQFSTSAARQPRPMNSTTASTNASTSTFSTSTIRPEQIYKALSESFTLLSEKPKSLDTSVTELFMLSLIEVDTEGDEVSSKPFGICRTPKEVDIFTSKVKRLRPFSEFASEPVGAGTKFSRPDGSSCLLYFRKVLIGEPLS